MGTPEDQPTEPDKLTKDDKPYLTEHDEPYFDPRESARSYSAAAVVLAGFCFAAIVLVVGAAHDACNGRCDRSVVALITAFLACVVSSFAMALVVAESKRSVRVYWLALIAGSTLAIAGLFALWGVLELVVVLTDDGKSGLRLFAIATFVVTTVIVAVFVLATAVNVQRSMAKWGRVVAGGRKPAVLAKWLVAGQTGLGLLTFVVALLSGVKDAPAYWIAGPELLVLLVAVCSIVWISSFGTPRGPQGSACDAGPHVRRSPSDRFRRPPRDVADRRVDRGQASPVGRLISTGAVGSESHSRTLSSSNNRIGAFLFRC